MPLSVLLPVRNGSRAVAELLPELDERIGRLHGPLEVLVIDDHSDGLNLLVLEELRQTHPGVRVLRLDRPSGMSAALTAGIAAANGDRILAIDPCSGHDLSALDEMVERLVRADLVVARPRRTGWSKWWHRVRRVPRWMLLGLEVRDPKNVFWAARAETLLGLELPCGMHRYLATFVAMRGFRVAEISVELPLHHSRLSDGRDRLGDLLCAWWLRRRWRNFRVSELCSESERTVRLAPLPPATLPLRRSA